MRILRTSRNAADCPYSTIPKGLRIGCFFSSDMAFTFRCLSSSSQCNTGCWMREEDSFPRERLLENLLAFVEDGVRLAQAAAQ